MGIFIYNKTGIVKIVYSYLADEPVKEGDVVYYWESRRDFGGQMFGTNTLITDLSLNEEDIFMTFKSKVRNEVRWAEKNNAESIIERDEQIEDDSLKEVLKHYQRFHDSKKLSNEPFEELFGRYRKFRDCGNLAITKCKYEQEDFVYHIYLLDEDKVALNISFSDYRERQELRQIIGKLNRFLHWKDMQYFKNKGIETYDWGGFGDLNSAVGNISKFKAEFCGEKLPVYEGFCPNTIKGRIYLFLRSLK